MTVAAAILSATAEGALADTLGQPRVRRLVDVAWSGGALPVVVLSPDPDGSVARALIGSEAIHGLAAPAESGPVGQMARAAELARSEVLDTTAVLLWPARMIWVGPETVTSLIEAHGVEQATILRPAWHGEAGWPVLVPSQHLGHLSELHAQLGPDEVVEALSRVASTRLVELGDPGVVRDADTGLDDLPMYEGPPDPAAGHSHEWGDDVVAEADLTAPDDHPAR